MIRHDGFRLSQWDRIAHFLPAKAGDPGRRVKDNRLFVHGVMGVLRNGTRWRESAHDLAIIGSGKASQHATGSAEQIVTAATLFVGRTNGLGQVFDGN